MYCFTMQHSFDPSMLIVHHPIELGDPLQMNRWVCRGFALTCPGWLCCNGEWTRAIVTRTCSLHLMCFLWVAFATQPPSPCVVALPSSCHCTKIFTANQYKDLHLFCTLGKPIPLLCSGLCSNRKAHPLVPAIAHFSPL